MGGTSVKGGEDKSICQSEYLELGECSENGVLWIIQYRNIDTLRTCLCPLTHVQVSMDGQYIRLVLASPTHFADLV